MHHEPASVSAAPAWPRPGRRNLDKLRRFLTAAMFLRRPSALVLALSSLLAMGAGSAAQAQYSRPAERVLTRAFAATGGAGWYALRGWHETGRRGAVAYDSWIDPLRYGLRTETREAQGLRIHGFNGQAEWEVAPDGAITAVNDHAALTKARTEAFFAASCFFFRGRFDARGDYVGVRSLGGRSFEVVRIQPWGGERRELWFDQRSGLLTRIVDRTGPRAAAVRVSDYRKVGPVLIPFSLAPEAKGANLDPLLRQRQTLVFAPVSRDRFSLNRPEELARVEAAKVDAARPDAIRRPAATSPVPAPP
jgi:hypothetical protein